jgi:hypothetical protein
MKQDSTTTTVDNGFIARTPQDIEAYRLLALKGALKLESLGMKRRGPSALSIVRSMGIRARTAKAALPLYEAWLRETGVLI